MPARENYVTIISLETRQKEKVFAILSSLGLTAQLEMSCVSVNAAVKFSIVLVTETSVSSSASCSLTLEITLT